MGVHLVTGKAGAAHITSDNVAALNAAAFGEGDCVVDYGSGMAVSLVTTNKAHVADGMMVMQGRQIMVEAGGVDLTIENGTQGQKRNDLVVMRYEKAKAGIESAALKVVKGTPATGAAADPDVEKGDILHGGASANEVPICRIPLDGISVGEPVPLLETVPPLKDAWDSVSRDYIVERGEGGVWEWERWASGRAVCRAAWSGEYAHYSDNGAGLYHYIGGQEAYPFAFSGVPHVDVSVRIGSGLAFACNMADYRSADARTSVSPYAMSTQAGPAYAFWTVRAEGMA